MLLWWKSNWLLVFIGQCLWNRNVHKPWKTFLSLYSRHSYVTHEFGQWSYIRLNDLICQSVLICPFMFCWCAKTLMLVKFLAITGRWIVAPQISCHDLIITGVKLVDSIWLNGPSVPLNYWKVQKDSRKNDWCIWWSSTHSKCNSACDIGLLRRLVTIGTMNKWTKVIRKFERFKSIRQWKLNKTHHGDI